MLNLMLKNLIVHFLKIKNYEMEYHLRQFIKDWHAERRATLGNESQPESFLHTAVLSATYHYFSRWAKLLGPSGAPMETTSKWQWQFVGQFFVWIYFDRCASGAFIFSGTTTVIQMNMCQRNRAPPNLSI